MDPWFVWRELFPPMDDGGLGGRLLQTQFITAADVPRLDDLPVATVIDLTGPGEASDAEREQAAAALAELGIARLHVPVTGPADIHDACTEVARAVDAAAPYGAMALVHCHGGSDRSVCAATAVTALMADRAFGDQLARMFGAFPDIAPSRSVARRAAEWTERALAGVDPTDDRGTTCPGCAGRENPSWLWGGTCAEDVCGHTACPFCRDGRGTHADGCPHVVLEAVDRRVEHSVFRRTGAMPWYPGDEAAPDRLVARAIGPWLATPEDPWPAGLHQPPDARALHVLAAAFAGGEVRATSIAEWDFAEDGSPVAAEVVRVYARDPALTARRAEDQLDRLAFVMDHFGTVETGVTP